MKYLILRKRQPSHENPFTEFTAAGGARKFEYPFSVKADELDDNDVADLRRDPSVEDLIPSMPLKLISPMEESSQEPYVQSAWGIEAVGASSCKEDGTGVTVAVLDTGIDRDHVAFRALDFGAETMRDFTVDDRGISGSASDTNGHGTHVCATIFGRDVGGTRIGVAPGIKRALIGKVLGPQGGTTEGVLNALEWALRERADVISMSLGMALSDILTTFVRKGYPPDIAASRALEAYRSNVRLFDRLSALTEARGARGRGALVLAASGNESRRQEDLRFTVAVAPPAAADGIISVGAVTRTDDRSNPFAVANFSNTNCLLAAPGVSILSAKIGGGLVTMSGTSMATPHAAGVMALWTQRLFPDGSRPDGWVKDVLRAVESHVRQVPGQARKDLGLGIVQAPGG